jgi:hypothetical protein
VHIVFISLFAFFFNSCSSTKPVSEPRYITPEVKKPAAAALVTRQFLPTGWADITSRSKRQQVKLWLINRDYSATMVLREMLPDNDTRSMLLNEEMNIIASISLRSKIPENNPDYRVTRVPAIIDMKRNFSSYAYSENGLLRRVIVYRNQDRFMELELMQEQPAAEFDALTNDLVSFATTLFER